MNRTPDSTLQALRPQALDELAAESYARRREQDIARVLAATSEEAVPRTERRRMPRLLTAGLAAGAVAAAAVGVIVATGDSSGTRTPAPAASQRLDARTVLLASAEGAAKAPATTGKYWYTRERETRLVGPARRRSPRSEALAKKRGKKSPPVTAYVTTTQETWSGRDRRDRTIVGIDRKITFPSAAEEAKWKALGSPELEPWSAKRHVNDYDFSDLKLTKTQRNQTVSALAKLPSEPKALEKALRGWYRDENQASLGHDGVPMSGDFAQYVFGTAQDLLVGPITPATKSALFRMLAEQPGITYLGTGTDRLGRKGAVLAGKGGIEIRLIIDPETGQLLEQDSGDRKSPMLVMTYQSMGWVNHLDDRP
ncbi:CU044_5270 family protein [Actinomadura sp. NPDC000600]|uniref:CU044_5270 family protein n=1 Tax=Actinomadura sp. NPDC000600 TaxID=3154262 RepID=UPI0033997D16